MPNRYFCTLDAAECLIAKGSVEKRIARMRAHPERYASAEGALDLAKLHALARVLATVSMGRGWAIWDAAEAGLMATALDEHVADLGAAFAAKSESLPATEALDMQDAIRRCSRVARRLREPMRKEIPNG